MPLSVGDKLGPYEILAPIGAGGMGEVWKARDTRLDRVVAIKRLKPEHAERFKREARAIAALNHPHICQIYDVGPDYLVMEYVEGEPLKSPLPPDEAVRLAIQIAEALGAAHRKGIIHRDLKPANILVTGSGVKLLDFGLAKMEEPIPGSDAFSTLTVGVTEAGAVVGTVAYMSPEQAQGQAVDTRSDIFSFGLVLYEALSGKRAFTGATPFATMSAIVREEPSPLQAPPELERVVTRCLRKSTSDRFQTMTEILKALEQIPFKPAEQQPSIAVLPFVNIGADKENEYFSDGLAEEILNLLAKIPGLKVIARVSSFSFRGKDQDIRKIADALGVNTILEGSVRRAGNRLRVTVQLIHAADGTHLWSERYDRDMTDVFAIQDEISQAISEALQLRLAPRAQAVNIEAYQNYLKGQYYRARYTPESLAKARECFEKALAIDANYAPAHSGLAGYYYTLVVLGIKPASEMAPLAKSAAEKALVIDPANSEARTVLGIIAGVFDYDWKLAQQHHRKVIAAEPVAPMARLRYVMNYLLPLGRTSDAMEQVQLALETDPLSMPLHWGMLWSLYSAAQYNEAIEYAHRAMEIDANFYFLWYGMGLAQLRAGLVQEAIASLKRVVELAPWYDTGGWSLAAAYHRAGDHERGQELARKLAASGQAGGAALYYAASGEVDAMFEALDAAHQQRDWSVWYVQVLPFFDRHRADPRFQALLTKTHLA